MLPKQVFYGGKASSNSFSEIADAFRRTFMQAVKTNENDNYDGPNRGPTALGNQPERFLTKLLYPIQKD